MSETHVSPKPFLHPVLTLRKAAIKREAQGGGKKESDVVVHRLNAQRLTLARQVSRLRAAQKGLQLFSDHILLVAEMFDDSFAFSKTPRDLFRGRDGVLLRGAATADGYLIEVHVADLPELERRIAIGSSIGIRCDISRVKTIRAYGESDVYRGRLFDQLWEAAPEYERGRAFVVWFSPFRNLEARQELIESVDRLEEAGTMIPTSARMLLGQAGLGDIVVPDSSVRENSLAVAQRQYRSVGHGRSLVQVPSRTALRGIIASGSVFRIDPVQQISLTSPGEGKEPSRLPRTIATEPIVGIVDGGCTASRYESATAWRETPFVGGAHADTKHGNQVASVVVHGHEWNNNLPLPELYCRIGIAQAVPKASAGFPANPQSLISYMDSVMARHPETKVWNLSWNESAAADPVYVSLLGHELSILARKHKVLLVISAGNVSNTDGDRVAPPADSEAALVVGGRSFDKNGNPGGPCAESLCGHGPEYQLVPHVASFSPLRILGGVLSHGTSFPTGLISALAAHTFHNLRDPVPDMVRALVVNRTELDGYDKALGWGTPSADHMPWNCAPGTVTLGFRAALRTGIRYYWEGIPIPRELTRNGKLFGRVSLTTVHRPLCNPEGGPSYITTRVGAAVQYPNLNGSYARLLGSKENEDTPELVARSEEFKWQPFRRDCRNFTKSGGIGFNGSSFRIYARLFARNIEQFGYRSNAELPDIDAVFVVTFSDGSGTDGLYNSMASSLGNFVESAVIDQDITIEH
jgi:hypothetical protein